MADVQPSQKIVFAIAPDGQGDGVPLVIVGIPEPAWRYMRNGRTQHFDLMKVGVPAKFMLFGDRDRAKVIHTIEEANKIRGLASLHVRDLDFSIQPHDPAANDEPGLPPDLLEEARVVIDALMVEGAGTPPTLRRATALLDRLRK